MNGSCCVVSSNVILVTIVNVIIRPCYCDCYLDAGQVEGTKENEEEVGGGSRFFGSFRSGRSVPW